MWDWLKSILVDSEAQGEGRGSARTSRGTSTRELGERGENLAARHLQDKGYKILLRNFRTEAGEIDIIAREGKTLVFVEVKTREDDARVEPDAQVDMEKMQQVIKVAKLYLSRYGVPQPPYRFDVVGIVWPVNVKPRVKHVENAFRE